MEYCREAITYAQANFDIPQVVTPEDFASEYLDELSGMTYLSYFMAKKTPGFKATLKWVQETISPTQVNNFTVR